MAWSGAVGYIFNIRITKGVLFLYTYENIFFFFGGGGQF